jgi:hypothetical protein
VKVATTSSVKCKKTTTMTTAAIQITSSTPDNSDCRACGGRCVMGRPVLPHNETKQTIGSETAPEK